MMSTEVDRLNETMKRAVNIIARQLLLNVRERLTETNPVDTGFSRSNWIPSVGAPAAGVVGSKEAVDYSGIVSGTLTILSYDLFKGPAFITNNVDYIVLLNQGYSAQAPAQFVERAIEDGIRALDGMVIN